jgi:hypothetical protein
MILNLNKFVLVGIILRHLQYDFFYGVARAVRMGEHDKVLPPLRRFDVPRVDGGTNFFSNRFFAAFAAI